MKRVIPFPPLLATMAFAILCAAVLFLGGCAATPTAQSKNQVLAAVVGLTQAERLALLYTSLPRCPAPQPCSDATVVTRIRAADAAAYAAVKGAEANPTTVGAATAAIAGLLAVLPPPKTYVTAPVGSSAPSPTQP